MRVRALDIGQTVRHLLAPGQRGTILAVVSEAIYLRCASGELFWLTTAGIPRHPRSVRVPALLPAVPANTPFAVDEGGLLTIASHLVLDCRRAPVWSPPVLSREEVLPSTALPERICTVCSLLENLPPPAGLGTLLPAILGTDTRSPCSPPRAGGPSFPALAFPIVLETAAACRARDGEKLLLHAESLVGLGGGLTPSGDDFVGGLFFCLHHLSRLYPESLSPVDWADAIHRSSDRTNPISVTALNDLARGQGVEPLHEWLGAILTEGSLERMQHYAARLVRIGHSTGWDLLSGVLTGLLWISE
ncbi:MAG: DUF2877 domain-containing protein [Chloroflexia bacterium]